MCMQHPNAHLGPARLATHMCGLGLARLGLCVVRRVQVQLRALAEGLLAGTACKDACRRLGLQLAGLLVVDALYHSNKVTSQVNTLCDAAALGHARKRRGCSAGLLTAVSPKGTGSQASVLATLVPGCDHVQGLRARSNHCLQGVT